MEPFSVECLAYHEITDADARQLNTLRQEFSSEAENLSIHQFRVALLESMLFVVRRRDREIIGMATLTTYRKLSGLVGVVEDVVISKTCRGSGMGKMLMQMLIQGAKIRNVQYLLLTSRPKRKIARELYRSIGFTPQNTTLFRLPLQ